MALSGPRSPGTVVSDATAGTIAWANPSNAGASDNSYATCTFTSGSGANSQYLKATNFGFAIPQDAKIRGITVRVERSRTVAGASAVSDLVAYLVRDGVIESTGINHKEPNVWATTDEVVSYGHDTDLWGSTWTPAEVNSATFGFALRAIKTATGTPDGRIDQVTVTVAYTPANVITVVKLRSPEPPHGELATILAEDVSYGAMLMRQQSASFRISRSDPNLVEYAHLFGPDSAPPMFTIERPDGLHPWVGFLRSYKATTGDPTATFTLADHTWRLANARTKRTGKVTAASGRIITDTLREMEERAEPPLFVQLDDIGNGPGVTYEYRATSGADFLTQMAQFTGWEWGYRYDIDRFGVRTHLQWRPKRGRDYRNEVVLEEGKQIVNADWSVNYDAGIRSAVVIGAGPTFGERAAVAASQSGRAKDIEAQTIVPGQTGLGGTRVLLDAQLSGREALIAAARRMHAAPEYVTRQVGLTIQEPATDMERLNIGDIVSVRLATTDLGTPRELSLRVLGIAYDPDSLQHRIETQEVA